MAREKRSPSPGFGQRVAEALRALGYWSADKGSPDIQRFVKEHGTLYQYVHAYIYGGRLPAIETVVKLAGWLGVEPAWLVFGDVARQATSTADIDADIQAVIDQLLKLQVLAKDLEPDHRREIMEHLVRQIPLLVRKRREAGERTPASPSTMPRAVGDGAREKKPRAGRARRSR